MIRTLGLAELTEWPREINSQESKVIPRMSLTVREILERFRRGSLSPADLDMRSMEYNDEADNDFMDQIENARDIVDIWNIKQQVKQKIHDTYGKIQKDSRDRRESGNVDPSSPEDLSKPQTGGDPSGGD